MKRKQKMVPPKIARQMIPSGPVRSCLDEYVSLSNDAIRRHFEGLGALMEGKTAAEIVEIGERIALETSKELDAIQAELKTKFDNGGYSVNRLN